LSDGGGGIRVEFFVLSQSVNECVFSKIRAQQQHLVIVIWCIPYFKFIYAVTK